MEFVLYFRLYSSEINELKNILVRGEGGCHAIQDALNLGRALSSSSKEDVTAALPNFQKEMLQRGNEAVQRSRAVLGIGSGTNTDTAWGQKFQFVEA